MNIESLTIREARELAALFGGGAQPCPFAVGASYLIRTLTMTWVGKVERIVGGFLVLSTASWIADTGRYHLATRTEALSEVEPVTEGEVFVSLASIVDAREWRTALPTAAK